MTESTAVKTVLAGHRRTITACGHRQHGITHQGRPATTARTPIIVLGCTICFGTGKYWAKPGVLVSCPNGCTGFCATSTATAAPRSAGGCLVCGCTPAACAAGCGCTCCCSYLPAVHRASAPIGDQEVAR